MYLLTLTLISFSPLHAEIIIKREGCKNKNLSSHVEIYAQLLKIYSVNSLNPFFALSTLFIKLIGFSFIAIYDFFSPLSLRCFLLIPCVNLYGSDYDGIYLKFS